MSAEEERKCVDCGHARKAHRGPCTVIMPVRVDVPVATYVKADGSDIPPRLTWAQKSCACQEFR